MGFAPKSGMNAAFGDILNQGRYAVYVSNISEDGILIQGNNLWVPKQGTSGDAIKYENLARDFGVELGGWSFGAQFGDLNNDGTLDLYLTNGYISLDRNRSYWYDFSKVAGGNSTIIGDARNWPAFEGRSLSGYQSKRLWLNDGAGKFVDVAQAVGVHDTYDGRAVALADLWNRGVLDVVVANQKGPLLVYKNTVMPENEWIEFELEGTASNRSAIGARVTLFWNGQQQVQEVSGGSGFAAQNQRRLHFGLGKYPQLEKAVIRWPSGKLQTIDKPAAGQLLQDQGACMSQPMTMPSTPATVLACEVEAIRQSRQSLHRSDFHYLHPAGGALVVRHPRKLPEDTAGDRRQHRDGAGAGPDFLSQVGASGERVHQRDQRGDSAAIACVLAVRPVRGNFHHVQICVAHQGAPHLEPVEFRHLGHAFSRP